MSQSQPRNYRRSLPTLGNLDQNLTHVSRSLNLATVSLPTPDTHTMTFVETVYLAFNSKTRHYNSPDLVCCRKLCRLHRSGARESRDLGMTSAGKDVILTGKESWH